MEDGGSRDLARAVASRKDISDGPWRRSRTHHVPSPTNRGARRSRQARGAIGYLDDTMRPYTLRLSPRADFFW